jgi:hypothetical protein
MLLLVPGIPKKVKSKLAKASLPITLAEVVSTVAVLAQDLSDGDAYKQVAVLLVAKYLMDQVQEGIVVPDKPKKAKVKPPKLKASSATIYQFKITLKDFKPAIWRRIQVKNCSLDKLHEHIQTAMGWTNSHLHQFEIGGDRHGNPELLYEGWEDEEPPIDSRRTRLSEIIPEEGKRFCFNYLYDFGDGWEHEILFEGCPKPKKGTRYPLCVEGERACPPEDIGGIYGYDEFLETIADSEHERHEELMEWAGPFDPEEFDAKAATRDMRRGLPDWREMG